MFGATSRTPLLQKRERERGGEVRKKEQENKPDIASKIREEKGFPRPLELAPVNNVSMDAIQHATLLPIL